MMIAVPVSRKWVEYLWRRYPSCAGTAARRIYRFRWLPDRYDIRHLLLMRRAKHKGGVVESMLRQKGQRLRVNF